MAAKKVVCKDPFQKRYTYMVTEPVGKKFNLEFKPDLTPKQMLSLGVFDGNYFDGYIKEFPRDWFTRAKLSENRDASVNFFKVGASKPLSYWRKKGWVHPQDPRGWFQWYCRYYLGRRSDDDLRQIKRWKAMKRHVAQLTKNCKKQDLNCRRKQRQALLHWAYDSRKM